MIFGHNVATYPNCGKPLKPFKNKYYLLNVYKSSAISERIEIMSKRCCKCKNEKPVESYGKLKSSNDGLRYDCNDCRKEYRNTIKEKMKEKNTLYYAENKQAVLEKNKQYREQHKTEIYNQRKEYRNREEVKNHIKQKQKEYLPIRKVKIQEKRKTDLNFKMSEILRSKIHKILKNQKTSYANLIGCDLDFLKKWIEFRFTDQMSWENFGEYWQIDHILPINGFDFTKEIDKQICFHWTNLQPLTSLDNRQKSDKLLLHHYFNNIVNINRFSKIQNQYLGYQIARESLQWLRLELRYGKNPTDEDAIASEIGNPQPSLYVHYDKDMRKVQRLNGYGSEESNPLL